MIQTVHCVDVLTGGVASVLFAYANSCKDTCFNFISISPVNDDILKQVEACNGRVIAAEIDSNCELARAIDLAKRTTGAEIFQVHRNWHNLKPAMLAKRFGYKVVISHSHNVFPSSSRIKDIYHFYFKNSIKRYADACWGCSPEAIEFLYGPHPKNPLMLPNPISFERFKFSNEVRVAMRHELGLTDSFVIIHSGLAIPQKNHSFLLRVFASIRHSIPSAKLLLLGPSAEKDIELVNIARELDILTDVVFCGYVDNTEAYYAAGDFFLFPSLNEGLSLALCEAQAEGLSFIASSNITRSSDLFGNGIFLPIDQGVEPWVSGVLSMSHERNIPSQEAIDACPFNVTHSAPLLEETYAALLNGQFSDVATIWNEVF